MCGGGSGHEPAHAGFVGEMGIFMFFGSSLSVALPGQGMLTSMEQNSYSILMARIFYR